MGGILSAAVAFATLAKAARRFTPQNDSLNQSDHILAIAIKPERRTLNIERPTLNKGLRAHLKTREINNRHAGEGRHPEGLPPGYRRWYEMLLKRK